MNTGMATEKKIPDTYEGAIAELVARKVARWGEREREAAERQARESCPTLGLALIELAHRDNGEIDPDMRAAAEKALSAEDIRRLRRSFVEQLTAVDYD